jgi:hypothetical protein
MWINWQWSTCYFVASNPWQREYEIRSITRRAPGIQLSIVKSGIFQRNR